MCLVCRTVTKVLKEKIDDRQIPDEEQFRSLLRRIFDEYAAPVKELQEQVHELEKPLADAIEQDLRNNIVFVDNPTMPQMLSFLRHIGDVEVMRVPVPEPAPDISVLASLSEAELSSA